MGLFSIEVLIAALRVHGVELLSAENEAVVVSFGTDPMCHPGYVLHHEAHWFVIRRIGPWWFSLDSQKNEPNYVSDFALAALLHTMREDGYSIFVCTGSPLPMPEAPTRDAGRDQCWLPVEYLLPESVQIAMMEAESLSLQLGGVELGAPSQMEQAALQPHRIVIPPHNYPSQHDDAQAMIVGDACVVETTNAKGQQQTVLQPAQADVKRGPGTASNANSTADTAATPQSMGEPAAAHMEKSHDEARLSRNIAGLHKVFEHIDVSGEGSVAATVLCKPPWKMTTPVDKGTRYNFQDFVEHYQSRLLRLDDEKFAKLISQMCTLAQTSRTQNE